MRHVWRILITGTFSILKNQTNKQTKKQQQQQQQQTCVIEYPHFCTLQI